MFNENSWIINTQISFFSVKNFNSGFFGCFFFQKKLFSFIYFFGSVYVTRSVPGELFPLRNANIQKILGATAIHSEFPSIATFTGIKTEKWRRRNYLTTFSPRSFTTSELTASQANPGLPNAFRKSNKLPDPRHHRVTGRLQMCQCQHGWQDPAPDASFYGSQTGMSSIKNKRRKKQHN